MTSWGKKFVAFLFLACAAVVAQNSASRSGTVRDVSGAVIPNAEVTLASVDRGVSQKLIPIAAANFFLPASVPENFA